MGRAARLRRSCSPHLLHEFEVVADDRVVSSQGRVVADGPRLTGSPALARASRHPPALRPGQAPTSPGSRTTPSMTAPTAPAWWVFRVKRARRWAGRSRGPPGSRSGANPCIRGTEPYCQWQRMGRPRSRQRGHRPHPLAPDVPSPGQTRHEATCPLEPPIETTSTAAHIPRHHRCASHRASISSRPGPTSVRRRALRRLPLPPRSVPPPCRS